MIEKTILKLSGPILLVTIVATIVAGYFVTTMRIDPSIESMVIKSDPARVQYDQFTEVFGGDEYIYVVFKTEKLFSLYTFRLIDELTLKFEKIENIDQVVSLTNIHKVYGVGGDIMTGQLVPIIPTSEKSYDILARQLKDDPFYSSVIFNAETETAAIIVRITNRPTDVQYRAAIEEKIKEAIADVASVDPAVAEIEIVGAPVIKTAISDAIRKDQKYLIPIVLTLTALMLLFIYRNGRGVILPVAAIVIASLWTAGLMAAFDRPLTVASTMIFPVIIVIGVATSIHVFSQYFEDTLYIDTAEPTLLHTLSHMITPCFLTSLTTAVGFLSLTVARISPIREAGIFTAFGVLSVYFLVIGAIPAVLLYLPHPKGKVRGKRPEKPLGIFLEGSSKLAINRPNIVFILTGLIIAFSAAGISKINIETNALKFFSDSAALPRAYDYIENNLAGITTLDLDIVGPPGAFYDPDNLNKMAKISAELEKLDHYDKALSVADFVRMLQLEINFPESLEIDMPQTRSEVERLLFMFRRTPDSDDLNEFVTEDMTRARIAGRISSLSGEGIINLVDTARETAAGILGPEFKVEASGTALLYARMIKMLVEAQAESFLIACLIILITLTFVLRSALGGIAALFANFTPVVATYGLIGWFGFPLNITTAAVASVAIGIAVDDSIHLLVRYSRELEKGGEREEAIHRTVLGTGRAIFYSSVVLAIGFSAIAASDFRPSHQFGIFAAAAVICALFANIILLPALLKVFNPNIKVPAHYSEHTYNTAVGGRIKNFFDTVTGK